MGGKKFIPNQGIILLIIILALLIVSIYFANKNTEQIKKHFKIVRIFHVYRSEVHSSKLFVNFSFYNNNKLVETDIHIGSDDYDKFGKYIKDSTILVIDSTNTTWRELIYKPSQFKTYNLDTSDKFYKGLFDIDE